MSFQMQQKIRHEAEQRHNYATGLSSWAGLQNKKDPAQDSRKRKRNLPPVRGSVQHKVEPKKMEDGDPHKDNAARTKPLPPGVRCERYKIEGNNYFKRNEFQLAIDSYTNAIKAKSTNPIPWANRAMARLKLKQYKMAEKDCEECLKLDRSYVKAHYRRGQALQGLKKWALAVEAFQQVLALNPEDANAKKMLAFCEKKLTTKEAKAPQKKRKKKIMIEVVDDDEEEEEELKVKIVDGQDSSDDEQITPAFSQVVPKKKLVRTQAPSKNVEEVSESKPVKIQEISESKPVKIQEISESKPVKIQEISELEKLPTQKKIEVVSSHQIEDVKLDTKEEDLVGFIPKRSPVKLQVSPTKSRHNSSSPFKREKGQALPKPVGFSEFFRLWKRLQLQDQAELLFSYDPLEFPQVFGVSLESEFVSELIEVYASYVDDNTDLVFRGLTYLTQVKRFSLMLMFADQSMKHNLQVIWQSLGERHDPESVHALQAQYV